jgi:hypothetical protein
MPLWAVILLAGIFGLILGALIVYVIFIIHARRVFRDS